MLDCNWFSSPIFDTQLEGDHLGVQLQPSNLNFLELDSLNWTTTLPARQSDALKWVLFIAVSPLLAKLIIKNISPKGTYVF